MSGEGVLVGRQPVFDVARDVHGYELVLADDLSEPSGPSWPPSGAVAPWERRAGLPTSAERGTASTRKFLLTSAVVFGSLELGIDRFVGDKLMFCDVSEDILRGETSPLVPPERTVLEVPTGLVFGAKTASTVGPACHRLTREGYGLALDGFRWFDGAQEMLPLFSFVKVDGRHVDPAGIVAVVDGCRGFATKVIVQGIDRPDDMAMCQELGVDLYQGHLLLDPSPVPGRVLDPGQLASLRLAARLLDPDTGIAELESIVRTDPTLSLQLLRMAGIGAPGHLRRSVSTVREALVLVGWRRLQSWMSLLLFSDSGAMPVELLTAALCRARMCELLAPSIRADRAEVAFTAGILSILDVLLGVPMSAVVRHLPLADDVRDAVVDHSGPIGRLVADVIDYQLGSISTAVRSGISQPALQVACFDALAWAIEVATGLDWKAVA